MPKTKCFLKREMKGKYKKEKEEVDVGERTRKEGKNKKESRKGRRKIHLENMSIVIFEILRYPTIQKPV